MIMIGNDKRFFLNIFSIALIVYGISELPPFFVALHLGEHEPMIALGISTAVCIAAGILIRTVFDMNAQGVQSRMNYLTTILTWLILIGITTCVYFFGRAEFTWIDSFFEASASLTTTGMGTLDVSIFPYSLQLWRSMLNWLGGIGIILISVSFIRNWGFSGHSLASVEIPGPEFLKSSVTVKTTYRHILYIYLSLTFVHFILLDIAGMEPFDALLTALSNISTSGMQHIENGVITQLTTPVKVIITVFAFLGSVNVSFFILILMQKYRLVGRRTEVGLYVRRILLTSAVIALSIVLTGGGDIFSSFGDAIMQTVSFLSTSGYIVADCHRWPLIAQLIILLQMFVGACAVSTGGGIKLARVEIAFKTVHFGLFRHIHPRAVRPIKLNNEPVKQDQLVTANMFIALFMLIYIISAVFLSLDNKNESIFDALNFSQAMITNTGTSIAELDAPGLAARFSPLSKIIMSLEMLAGRLEIYPVLMLFFPSFWRSDSRL